MEEVMEPEDKYAIIRDALFRLGGRVRHDVLEGEVCGRKHRWRAEPVVLTNRSFKIYLKILVLKGHILKSEVDNALVLRFYNPDHHGQTATLGAYRPIVEARRCNLDEAPIEALACRDGRVTMEVPGKTIITCMLYLDG